MASLTKGTRVRFTMDGLGVLDPAATRPAILDWTVGKGDEGVYERTDEKGWHFITVERNGAYYIVPVAPNMIEVA